MTAPTLIKRKPSKDNEKIDESPEKDKLKYGPMPNFPYQRVWSRGIIIVGVVIYLWYFSKQGKETVLASHKDVLNNRGQTFDCDSEYTKDIEVFPNCVPKTCGRYVTDKLVTEMEALTLLDMAKKGFAFGGSSGGASILDIHSGALSYKDKFVNMHTIKEANNLFNPEFINTYKTVKEKIQHAIAELFQIEPNNLFLTHPTFFSKLTNAEPKTSHDKYWLVHIDKETYESFHYTALLYLSDYGADFKGGRFIFKDIPSNKTVEPKLGRVSMFTSGGENVHFVERVTTGTRYAITISFTCDIKSSINVPTIRN